MAVTVTDPEATKRARLLRLAGWAAGYLAVISLFALGFDAWWMVAAFAWFCFLGSIFLTIDGFVPELGVTAEVRAATGFVDGGVWERDPHRALAGGVLYFAVMGLFRPLLAWGFTPR